MALVFFHDLLSPVRCAVEIANVLHVRAEEIKTQTGGQIKLRMGIHTGPVLMVEDLNQQADVAGDGIVYAQRVMDCGDAEHILLSDSAAIAIEKIDPWARWLTDLGTCRVKHDVKIHLYNLCGRTVGSAANFGSVTVPTKVFADTTARRTEAVEREARQSRFEAEEGLRPYVRSLVMMLCVLCFIGCIAAAFALRSPKTMRDFFQIYAASRPAGGSSRATPQGTGSVSPSTTSPFGAGLHDEVPDNHGPGTNKTQSAPTQASAPQTVPDLSGQTLTQAKETGKNENLIVKESQYSGYTDEQGAGLVYKQEPTAGSNYRRGNIVRVAISKGPPPPSEPGDQIAPLPVMSSPVPSIAPPPLAPERYTGIIINASHLSGIKPDQYTKIMGEGVTLYPDDGDGEDMPIHFYKNLSDAKNKIGGSHPLILKAEGVSSTNGVSFSVRLSASHTKDWNDAAAYLDLNQSHKVGLVLPP